MKPSYN